MFSNIGGLEVLFVMLVALVVLGPTKLPEAARQVGKFVNEVRRVSSGFQKEFRDAVQDPIIEAEARARGSMEKAKSAVTEPFQSLNGPVEATRPQATRPTATPDPSSTPTEAAPSDEDTGSD